jgi:hypothetical protein
MGKLAVIVGVHSGYDFDSTNQAEDLRGPPFYPRNRLAGIPVGVPRWQIGEVAF